MPRRGAAAAIAVAMTAAGTAAANATGAAPAGGVVEYAYAEVRESSSDVIHDVAEGILGAQKGRDDCKAVSFSFHLFRDLCPWNS